MKKFYIFLTLIILLWLAWFPVMRFIENQILVAEITTKSEMGIVEYMEWLQDIHAQFEVVRLKEIKCRYSDTDYSICWKAWWTEQALLLDSIMESSLTPSTDCAKSYAIYLMACEHQANYARFMAKLSPATHYDGIKLIRQGNKELNKAEALLDLSMQALIDAAMQD